MDFAAEVYGTFVIRKRINLNQSYGKRGLAFSTASLYDAYPSVRKQVPSSYVHYRDIAIS